MRYFHRRAWFFTFMLLIGPAASLASAQEGFRQVTGPCHLTFPADHGAHPDYRTEWWYYTGNVTAVDGRRFGFQLTFFRSALQSADRRRHWPNPASKWRSDQVYLAHAAVSDIAGGRHLQAERKARPVLSMAGAAQADSTMTVHVHDWQTRITPDGHRLLAGTSDFSMDLHLKALKPLVQHGDAGYSRKGQDPQRASCYYSFTRLQATGTLMVDGNRYTVQGAAWMDHEYSTAPLQPGIVGWDWFSLQLSDQTEVMVFLLRHADGSLNPATSGTFVTASGASRHLRRDDIQITPLEHWVSAHSSARYPVQWRIQIPALQLNLRLVASLKDQEMRTAQSTGVTYWEGSVQATGNRGKQPIHGNGYVEMTGYAGPFDAPM